jgi:hypothetical protein
MLGTAESNGRLGSRIQVLVGLGVATACLLLALAVAPAPALGGEGPSCEATVTSTQDPGVAAIDVECDDEIRSVEVDTTEDGELNGNTGTECTGQTRSFTCEPEDPPSSLISAQFDAVSGDVCASPRLTVDFEVSFVGEGSEVEDINNVEVSGCSDTSVGGDEDDGATPEGGVDSGFGGTGAQGSGTGPALPIAGATLLLLLALALAGLFLRKTRTTP